MMNFAKAIKLLYHVENPEVVQLFGGNTEKLERELERMARRKFKFVVSMQRYSKLHKGEQENAEFLLRAYPDLRIAYLHEESMKKEGGEPRLFSALVDGHSKPVPETGSRRPKFRIQLPGNPILGDSKSDSQNHAIIFYHGKYVCYYLHQVFDWIARCIISVFLVLLTAFLLFLQGKFTRLLQFAKLFATGA